MTDQERIDGLLRHINLVRENCGILAEKFIVKGELELARKLIHAAQIHDAGKFIGIEWQFLTDPGVTNKAGLRYALDHHNHTNPHHVQYWGLIENMPDVFLAEMVCDWKARSTEFGTDLRMYLKNMAMKKFKIARDSAVHKKIVEYIEMLCPKPFESLENLPAETEKKPK
jgi:hypothetical protein